MKELNEIEINVISYLKEFQSNQGVYVIRLTNAPLRKQICDRLGFSNRGEVVYVGKAGKTKTSDLYKRSKQEMGWSNFDGATFVRKIGLYLGYDIKDKKNKTLRESTRNFILTNFQIECLPIGDKEDLLQTETDFIQKLMPCFNVKKNQIWC